MNRALLQSVLRIVSGEESSNDSTLLDAYRHRRDEEAFGQLVKRYARLVWHVCRNLTRCDADAEDAFQATFLVLARNAGKIARPERLGSWLHGVACRVCSKARREAGRRNKRERAVANGEASNGVTDSKWDRALAAVHEELAGMPEIYRLPFVLCCLEGRGTTEAASQLGWKLGTLSGRLTRAKDLLIARLESRGIAVGAVAVATFTVGTTNAPASIVANAVSIASGTTIPGSILFLSQGVIGMNFHRIKLLAAAIMLTGGLGIGLGTTWVANAQEPPKQKSVADPAATDRNTSELPRSGDVHNLLSEVQVPPKPPAGKWEYRFDRKPLGYAPSPERFNQTLAATETDGWEFVGQINTAGETADQPTLPTLVFRRPAHVERAIVDGDALVEKIARLYANQRDLVQEIPKRQKDDVQQKIRDLEAELVALKARAAMGLAEFGYPQKDLPLGISELKDILTRVAPKIGYKNFSATIQTANGGALFIKGDPESIEWAKRLIQTLSGTTDPVKPVRP